MIESMNKNPLIKQTYIVGQSVLVRKSTNIYTWERAKIKCINYNDTYNIEYIFDGTSDCITSNENIKPFDTSKIDLPVNANFDYIEDISTRNMLESGYRAIHQCEGWDILRNFTGNSFMFSQDEKIKKIKNRIVELYPLHSGCSIGVIMRILERISHLGINEYKNEIYNKV